jgi:hypothetical protein
MEALFCAYGKLCDTGSDGDGKFEISGFSPMNLFIALFGSGCLVIFIAVVVICAIQKRILKHVLIEATVVNGVTFLIVVPFLTTVYHAPGTLPAEYGFLLVLVPAAFLYILRKYVLIKESAERE